jgi:hypothetical protein
MRKKSFANKQYHLIYRIGQKLIFCSVPSLVEFLTSSEIMELKSSDLISRGPLMICFDLISV